MDYFPVKLTFEYRLPGQLDDESVKKITRHLFKTSEFWIFQEYYGSEDYIHLLHPDYLWVWTTSKNLKSRTIFGITTTFKLVDITYKDDPIEFEKFVPQLKGYLPEPIEVNIPSIEQPRIETRPLEQTEQIEIPLMEQFIGDEPYDNYSVQLQFNKIVNLSDQMYKSGLLDKHKYRVLLYDTNYKFKRNANLVSGNVDLNKTISYNTNGGRKYYESLPERVYNSQYNNPMFKYILPIGQIIRDLLEIKNDTVKTNLYYLLVDNLLI